MSNTDPGATGTPTGDQSQQPTDPQTPAQPQTPVPTPPAHQPQTPPTDPQQNDAGERYDDPEWTKAEIARLRRERGDERIQAKQNAAEEAKRDLLNTLTVALGGKPDGEQTPTVETLTQQVGTISQERDTAQQERDQALRSSAIVRAAVQAGVNPARLDYVEFLLGKRDDLRGVSPSDDAFGGTLTAAIADVIAQDSSLKTPGATIGTGGPGFSGTGAAGQMTKTEFDALPYAKRADLYRTNRAEYDRLVNS